MFLKYLLHSDSDNIQLFSYNKFGHGYHITYILLTIES